MKNKTIAFVPVRGGSKSIPLKNIKSFCGRPLVYWVAKAAQESSVIDRLVIATDHDEIIEVVLSFNFEKIEIYDRKKENADDHSSTESVMLEYIQAAEDSVNAEDDFFLIQATSPFLTAADLNRAKYQFENSDYNSLLSCVRIKRFFWNNDGEPLNYNFKHRPRRQDFDGILMENGAFYLSKAGSIIENKNRLASPVGTYEMPEYSAVELDEKSDWIIAEDLMAKNHLNTRVNFSDIKIVLTDVDGVLTDAGMYYSEQGDELKKFNTRDGKGLELLRKKGYKIGIITSEKTEMIERRGKKLKVDYLFQGIKNKIKIGREIARKEGVKLKNVAYIGDDINDLDLLEAVGFAACPSDAVRDIKNNVNIYSLSKKGGEGVVREFAEIILQNA